MQTEKVVDHIVDWLKTYAAEANIKGFVIGVSGGIDSAVTSTLCAKTGLDLICIEMPIHQGVNQVTRASNHIEWLQKNFDIVSREAVNRGRHRGHQRREIQCLAGYEHNL